MVNKYRNSSSKLFKDVKRGSILTVGRGPPKGSPSGQKALRGDRDIGDERSTGRLLLCEKQ